MSFEWRLEARSRRPLSRSERTPWACRCSLSRQKVAFRITLSDVEPGSAFALAQLEAAALCGAIASAASATTAAAARGMRQRDCWKAAAGTTSLPEAQFLLNEPHRISRRARSYT